MKRAAIAIDNWKLPIFERHLSEAGYTWEGPFQFTADTMILKVLTERIATLQPIIEAAQKECAQWKSREPH